MASYFFVRCYSSFFLGTTHSESIFPWPRFDLPRMSHKDFLTPVTCVKMLGLGNMGEILGIFWVEGSTSDTRLERKKRWSQTIHLPSVRPKAPWVWAEFREVFDQRLRLFATFERNRFHWQILEAKKKIVQLSVAYISMFKHFYVASIKSYGKMMKNVQCQTFWEAWCNQWLLSSGKIGWATWIPPKKKTSLTPICEDHHVPWDVCEKNQGGQGFFLETDPILSGRIHLILLPVIDQ